MNMCNREDLRPNCDCMGRWCVSKDVGGVSPPDNKEVVLIGRYLLSSNVKETNGYLTKTVLYDPSRYERIVTVNKVPVSTGKTIDREFYGDRLWITDVSRS